MKSRLAAALIAAGFALGGVSLSGTVASAAHPDDGKKPVACVNPAGHTPPGQQPECKGKAHTQVFKKDDKDRDKRDDKRDDKKDRDKRDDKRDDDKDRDKRDDKRDDKNDRDKRDDKRDDKKDRDKRDGKKHADKRDGKKHADKRDGGKKPVACVNPAGHKPPGQQPKCKGKAHTQIFG